MLRLTMLFALLAGMALGSSGCRRAEALESFTLGEHDHLIAEAPGCNVDCRIVGTRRVCTLKDPQCRVVCKTLPECRPDGKAIQVCAVIPTRL